MCLCVDSKKASRYVSVIKKDVAQSSQSVATFHLVRNSRQTIHSLLQRFPLTTKERQELQQRLERNQYNEGMFDFQANSSFLLDVWSFLFLDCDWCYRSVVCLSLCLSVTFVHCAQMAEDIDTFFSFAHDSSISLSDRVKIWLTSVDPFLSKFALKWPTLVDLSVGDIQWQIVAKCLEIVQWP